MKSIFISLFLIILFLGLPPNYGYAQIQKKIIKVEQKGKRGYLGVEVQDVTKKLKDKKNLSVNRGAYVQSVVEDSPAEEAGILKGDVIVKFGDLEIDDSDDLKKAVRKIKPKTQVKVDIYRKSEMKTLNVKIGKVKSPKSFAFNFDDDNFRWFSKPYRPPKLSKTFNFRIFSESEINGLRVQSLTKQLGEYFGAPNGNGILVTEVEKGCDAEKAGFKAGDVITKVDNISIGDVDELQQEISDIEGKEIPFEVIRNGKSIELLMKMEEEEDEEY